MSLSVSWSPRGDRAREEPADAADAADASQVLVTQVPVKVGQIFERLEREAAVGDVQAARELRAWLDKYPPADEGFDLAALVGAPAMLCSPACSPS